MSTKIKVIGRDGQGWSIDNDRLYTEKALKELNYTIVKSTCKANIIFNVWYSYILKKKFMLLTRWKGERKIVNVITNDPEDNKIDMKNYSSFTDYWICANNKQKQFLLSQKIPNRQLFINPFYVDETRFLKLELNKKKIAEHLKIDFNKIENKFLIGSFQRDSTGGDLSKSKWHKNPELMIEILNRCDKNKMVLILAGPRRHFVVKECRKHMIPYIFVGDESCIDKMIDDVGINNLCLKNMNLLYNLIDLYLITSVSEGGPKAVIEAALTKTHVLSTTVGFASDLLDQSSLCMNAEDFIAKIDTMISNPLSTNERIRKNYEVVSEINNFEAYKQRIKRIIETVSNERQSKTDY
jgi:glycosyltransferase involved in cell wall biosynthesis